MADKYYVGDVGTDVIVDCGCNIIGATTTELLVKKPDNTEVVWVASISGTDFLKYTIVVDDFSLSGKYLLQASLILPGWSGRGETVSFNVYDHFK